MRFGASPTGSLQSTHAPPPGGKPPSCKFREWVLASQGSQPHVSAAWLLAQCHQVTVFEAQARPGSLSQTVDVVGGAEGLPPAQPVSISHRPPP